MTTSFQQLFRRLTDATPFPWQQGLYADFIRGRTPLSVDIPTGLGKTSVITIWLAALLTHPDRVPRRLVYIVNRRTVVDQTTAEVLRIRERLLTDAELAGTLRALCAVPTEVPLTLSTLRGQFADNREWCADPARPAVIVGTVDMIGSGLLFSRYTCGFKARPHHAAFLGQDALIVHDEAHLEPAFQALLTTIAAEQARCRDFRPARVLELTATSRGNGAAEKPFSLAAADEQHLIVRQRLDAAKHLRLHTLADDKNLVTKLVELSLTHRDAGRAVLVFARSVEVVQRVAAELCKQRNHTEVLTGTMRGWERDQLAEKNPTFLRFLPPSSRPKNAPPPVQDTAYLVATSAGEVGVNLSADDLVCDLSTYESLAQRFGRVNRFGELVDTTIDLVHPETFDPDDPLEVAHERTLSLLKQLKGDASPRALRALDPTSRLAAFSPPPALRPATDILFDAWSLTTIRGSFPGRPPVGLYLHGERPEWEAPETYVAWREEVSVIKDELLHYYSPEELLADFPLKPHELLRDRSSRVRDRLAQLVEQPEKACLRAWLVAADGSVKLVGLADLVNKDAEAQLHDATVVLPPAAGGLSAHGMLDPKAPAKPANDLDVADVVLSPAGVPLRCRIRCDEPVLPQDIDSNLRLVRMIDTQRHRDEPEAPDETETASTPRYWLWLEAPFAAGTEGTHGINSSVLLDDHVGGVVAHARAITRKLHLPDRLAQCVLLAAEFHDLGKKRRAWQRSIGNFTADLWLAKRGRELDAREIGEPYRHEFGSLLDVTRQPAFATLTDDEQDLVLHLIAAHHGRARPHFPAEETFDPEGSHSDAYATATEIPRRFARLQRRYGRWGLAYLESLLRSADYAASAGITPAKEDKP